MAPSTSRCCAFRARSAFAPRLSSSPSARSRCTSSASPSRSSRACAPQATPPPAARADRAARAGRARRRATARRGAAAARSQLGLERSVLRLQLVHLLDEHGEAVVEALQLLLLVSADDLVLIGARRRLTRVQAVGRRGPAVGQAKPSDEAEEQAAEAHCSGTATASGSYPRRQPLRSARTGVSRSPGACCGKRRRRT